MSKYKTGDKFNHWTLVCVVAGNSSKWISKCVCGKEKEVWICHLRNGKSISCSCIGKSTHNLTKSPEYNSWSSAKQRCTNSNNARYFSYGKRGIKMCDRWLNSFENFLLDMGKRPPNTSLDRINVNGDYCPENCRWATAIQQSNNTVKTTESNLGCSLKEYCRKNNLSYSTV